MGVDSPSNNFNLPLMIRVMFTALFFILGIQETYGQDWRLVGSEPNGHDPRKCQRCQHALAQIGTWEIGWGKRFILDYYTKPENLLEDYIEFREQNGLIHMLAVMDLSSFDFPKIVNFKDMPPIEISSFGAIDETHMTLEGIYSPTPNQVRQSFFPVKFESLTEPCTDQFLKYFGEFNFEGGSCYAFVSAIDQAKINLSLKIGKFGITRNIRYSSLNAGFDLIDELHKQHYHGIKKKGLQIIRKKEENFRLLHLQDPVDLEEEKRKEAESRRIGELIRVNNAQLLSNYEMLVATVEKNGGHRSSVPYPDLEVHVPYYAHPSWLEIAEVYRITREQLEMQFSNWDRVTQYFPYSELKSQGDTDFESRRKIALGSETKEGFYKVRIHGEFRLHILPNGKGKCVIRKSRALRKANDDIAGYQRSDFQTEFSYTLSKSPDFSCEILEVLDYRDTKSNKFAGNLPGSELSDYRVEFHQGKIRVFGKSTGTEFEVERLRNVVLSLDKKSQVSPPPIAFSLQPDQKESGETKLTHWHLLSTENELLNLKRLSVKASQPISLTYHNKSLHETILVFLQRNLRPNQFILNEQALNRRELGIPFLVAPRESDEMTLFQSEVFPASSGENEINFKAPSIQGDYQFFLSVFPISNQSKRETGFMNVER